MACYIYLINMEEKIYIWIKQIQNYVHFPIKFSKLEDPK